MLSQLAATVGLFRSLGIRPEVSHLAFEPVILDALPPAPTEAVDISFVGTVSADHQQRVALLEAIARRYEFKLFGNIAPGARLLSAAPLLSRRGLGRGHVSGPASFAHYA
jgi:hypothetical protein